MQKDLATKNYIPMQLINAANKNVNDLITQHIDYTVTLFILTIPEPLIKTMSDEEIIVLCKVILPLGYTGEYTAFAVAMAEVFEEHVNRTCPTDKYFIYVPQQTNDMVRLGGEVTELNDDEVNRFKQQIIDDEGEEQQQPVPLSKAEWLTQLNTLKSMIDDDDDKDE